MRRSVNALLAGVALLCCACGGKTTGGDNGNKPGAVDTTGKVLTYITTADNTMHMDLVTRTFGEGMNMSPELTLTLNPQTRFQEFDGFGAALTSSACFNLLQMNSEERAKLLKETFSVKEGMGYSYVRVPIGGSDFNCEYQREYSCCDTKGIENFAFTKDETKYIIPILKEVLAINPDLKIMGTPWSCPKWMKIDDLKKKNPYDSWVGGHLNPDYYQDWATYFVKWIQGFAAEGIHINSVTVENEPLNWGNSMSLYMEWEECRDFVKTALGPAFKAAGLDTKIIVFDHNYNYDNKATQMQYPLKIYKDAEAAQYIDGAAYHNYGGGPDELLNVHSNAPEKNLYFTEASIGTWNCQDFGSSLMNEMKNTCLAPIQRWCKTVIVWNYMLDSDGGPYGSKGACSTCFGCVDISKKDYSTLNRRSHFFTIGHMSKAFKAGSTRIDVSGYCPRGVTAVAAENTDGTYGLVLLNEQDAPIKDMVVEVGKKHFVITLPGKSVTSCVWEK